MYSHEEGTALLLEKTPFSLTLTTTCVEKIFDFFSCTHTFQFVWVCVHVQQPVGFYVFLQGVLPPPLFPKLQSSATNQTTPQRTSAGATLCPAMTCWSLVCFGSAAVWSWSEEEIDAESEWERENKKRVISWTSCMQCYYTAVEDIFYLYI